MPWKFGFPLNFKNIAIEKKKKKKIGIDIAMLLLKGLENNADIHDKDLSCN